MFEQIQDRFANQGQVLGSLMVTQRVVIFADDDVKLPVQGVFNGPMAAPKSVGLDRGERPVANGLLVAKLEEEETVSIALWT